MAPKSCLLTTTHTCMHAHISYKDIIHRYTHTKKKLSEKKDVDVTHPKLLPSMCEAPGSVLQNKLNE